MKNNTDIETLFQARDEAVRQQDPAAFLSTQVSEIESGASSAYLSVHDMTTQVLHVHDESEDVKVVFVKETYKPSGKLPRSLFKVYSLANTLKGWRIYHGR